MWCRPSCISDWLLLCAMSGWRTLRGWQRRCRASPFLRYPLGDSDRFSPAAEEQGSQKRGPGLPDQALLSQLRSELDFVYPYAGLRGVPTKVADDLAAEPFSFQYAATARAFEQAGLTLRSAAQRCTSTAVLRL
ncbi:MAG: hypothetical protein ACLS8R_00615 [Anaeromassilibacillus sp.]